MPSTCSIVLCTFNRGAALSQTMPCVLEMEGVDEIVVVVDGSTDDTMEVLGRLRDPRLVVIEKQHVGSAPSRNHGVRVATGEWVLLLDDDDFYPADYGLRLMDVAEREAADIVCAPWVHARSEHVEEDLREASQRRADRFSLNTHPSTFPASNLQSPFGAARALVRRRVFQSVQFDIGCRGNAWREETGFYLDSVVAGFRVVITPETASFHTITWNGGQHRHRLAYEWWTVRNNWRFLRRHTGWLVSHHEISSVWTSQMGFMWDRAVSLTKGKIAARRRRVGAII